MDYHRLHTTPGADSTLCILERSPEGTERNGYKLADGEAIGSAYPASPNWDMSKDFPGLKVASLVDSTARFLVVRGDLKDVIAATGVPLEALPFVLVDHKGRVASRDHFIVNVLGTRDCLNLDRSDIKWSTEVPGAVVRVKKLVLDPKKLEGAPDIFRVREDPPAIVVSDRLAARLRALTPSNLHLLRLDQVAAGS